MTIIPPQDIEIEECCLGCAVISNQALLKLISEVNEEDFYFDKCRLVFNCLKELYKMNIKIDLIAIKNNINTDIDNAWLINLWKTTTTSTNIDYYIKQLHNLSDRRKLLLLGQETQEKIYQKYNPTEIINNLSNQLRNFNRTSGAKIINSKDIFKEPLDKFRLHPQDFIKTGIQGFDEHFWGLYKSEVVTIAARPSQGKSALALNIAHHVSKTDNVLFFSIEMPIFFLSVRLLSAEANIDSERIIHNKIDKWEREELIKASERLSKLNLHFIDNSGLTGERIDSDSRRFNDQSKLGLIVVDYIQILKNTSKENRYLRIGEDMKIIKNIARDLNIPVIAISQLGREVEKRTNSIPILSDLKESGSIEDDSDKVIFIYFENEGEEGKLILAKNKYGSKGNTPVRFERRFNKFV